MEGQMNLEALAEALANKVRARTSLPRVPALRIVPPPPPRELDMATREFMLRRIRFLKQRYGLQWIVDQHLISCPSIERLEDRALSTLFTDLERGRQCLADGISFDDVGLIQDTSQFFAEDHAEWT
jgi:hypothetical protein